MVLSERPAVAQAHRHFELAKTSRSQGTHDVPPASRTPTPAMMSRVLVGAQTRGKDAGWICGKSALSVTLSRRP